MKKFLLSYVIVCIAFASMAQKPDGAFKVVAATYGTSPVTQDRINNESMIKIFKDGHWFSAFFGRPDKPFNGVGGGTFKTDNGKYIEKLDYYSWDSTAVGKVFTFDFTLKNDEYFQHGYINSDQYKNYLIDEHYSKMKASIPLNSNALEGAWEMQTGDWGSSKIGEGKYKGVTGIKVYAYPRFAFAFYNPTTHSFVGAGGGTYQFDGTTVTEQIEYWSWGKPKLSSMSFAISFGENTYTQQGNGITETWKRAK